MITIVLEHASSVLKGSITKWLTLVKPGIYIGNVNVRIRDNIISYIQQEYKNGHKVSAQVYYSAKNELGFSVIEIGTPTKILTNFQGLILVSDKNKADDLETIADLCWAKLNPYKSLFEHMYETGALAIKFLTRSKYSSLVPIFKECIIEDIETRELINSLGFVIALHDIGKAFPNFQKKAVHQEPLEWQIKKELELIEKQSMISSDGVTLEGFRHESASALVVDSLFSKTPANTKEAIKKIYENHHLVKKRLEIDDMEDEYEDSCPEKWKTVQKIVFDKLEKEFSPNFQFELKENKRGVFTTLLIGFLYRCDWIASSIFTRNDFESYSEYKSYIDRTSFEYIQNMQIEQLPRSNHKKSIKEMFPELSNFVLRPLQRKSEELHDIDFDCVIIEDLTGSGKTEAGFYLAFQAMYRRCKQGLFFALPTNATEETMNPRIQGAINSIYDSEVFSVTHATGTSWIKESLNSSAGDEAYRMGSSKETKLIFPFSTGTIDQIMKSVTLQKYALIPLMELATKAVVIDEMHAYDAYMQGILFIMLKWLKVFHVPVVIMSATLSNNIKKEIHKIYTKDSYVTQNSYPMISVYSKNRLQEFKIESTESRKYKIETSTINIGKDKFEDFICDSVDEYLKKAGNLCIICNTVNTAKKTYSQITKKFPNIEAYLFHGQDSLKNKHDMTDLLVSKYGKDRTNRPNKSIVVATQIVEQSIDLDFDYMITEIAPIDLLIQRFGRWHRHSDIGTIREKDKAFSPIKVVIFDDLKKHYVYREHVTLLKKTKEYLQNHTTIKIPEQSREMIEYVYDFEDYSLSEKNLENERHGIADFETIKPPDITLKRLPYSKKSDLKRHVPTRYSEGEWKEDLCILPEQLYEQIKENPPDKELSAKIRYEYTYPINKNIIEKIPDEQKIEGQGWLTDCIITTQEAYETVQENC